MTLYSGKRYDVAEAVLGRDDDGRLVVEAHRPKANVWRVEVDSDLAASPLGRVAVHHFNVADEELVGDGNRVVWHVEHHHAEQLVEVLAHLDHEDLVALIHNQLIHTKEKNLV